MMHAFPTQAAVRGEGTKYANVGIIGNDIVYAEIKAGPGIIKSGEHIDEQVLKSDIFAAQSMVGMERGFTFGMLYFPQCFHVTRPKGRIAAHYDFFCRHHISPSCIENRTVLGSDRAKSWHLCDRPAQSIKSN